ncbi:MAG: radical SAM protein [Candidatus Heimdallarchaeota archaeon]
MRVSFAAALTMGLTSGQFYRDAKLYTLNILLTYSDGCKARCAYCGLSCQRTRQIKEENLRQSFIRVPWPVVPLDTVLMSLGQRRCSHLERLCVSMVYHQNAPKDTLEIVSRVRERSDLAISVLISPTIINSDWLTSLRDCGADWVGVGIDASTPHLFSKFRGQEIKGPHCWSTYWTVLRKAAKIFSPEKISVHLIVGLGETDQEFLETVQYCKKLGVTSHLFSFMPEPGTLLEDVSQPPIHRYRRLQLARYLIEHRHARFEDLEFEQEGSLIGFGKSQESLLEIIESGEAFMTSGCDGHSIPNACNRPFSNTTPYQALQGEIRNFPFSPSLDDIQLIKCQLGFSD